MSLCNTEVIFRHIRAAVQQINKRTFKPICQDLLEICDLYGCEARVYFVACLIEELDHKDGKANQHIQKLSTLTAELERICCEDDFVRHLIQLFEYIFAEGSKTTAALYSRSVKSSSRSNCPVQFCEDVLQALLERTLRLNVCGQISIATAFAYSSDPLTAAESSRYLQKRLVNFSSTALADAAPIGFSHLNTAVSKALLGLFHTSEHFIARLPLFKAILCEIQAATASLKPLITSPASPEPLVLISASADRADLPFLCDCADEISCDTSKYAENRVETLVTALVSNLSRDTLPESSRTMDIGYNITSSAQTLRDTLATIRRGNRLYGLLPLSEAEAARLLVAMGNSLNLFVLGAHEPTVGPTAVAGAANPAAVVGTVLDALAAAAGSAAIYGGRAPSHPVHPEMTWRHDVVAAVLRDDHSHLDWHGVIASLDFPECNLTSPHAFQFIVAVTNSCAGVFPIGELLRKPFSNARAHVDALRHAVATPADVISFKKGVAPNRILNAVSTIGNPNFAWCCVDLYHVLFKLAQSSGGEVEGAAYHIIDQAQAAVPELVLLSIAQSKVDDRVDEDIAGSDPLPMRNRRCLGIISLIFGGLFTPGRMSQPNSQQLTVLARLWDISRPLAATSLLALGRSLTTVATSEADQLRLSLEGVARVVNLTLLLPDFATVLLSAPAPQLAIEVAVYLTIAGPEVEARVAAEPVPQAWQGINETGQPAGGFKLEAWLSACLGNTSAGAADRFAAACVAFLKRVVNAQQLILASCRVRAGAPADGSGAVSSSAAPEGGVPQSPLAVAEQHAQEAANKEAIIRADILITFFRVLKNHASSFTPSTASAVNAVSDAAAKVYPGLAMANNQEIEDLANTYFQRIYTSQQSMSEVIEMLKRFKNSSDPREKEIFKYMIHNLFDEYRFFERYPDKELRITGVLFGLLVQHQLVASATLGIALRYVLEALRKPPVNAPNTKMYRFGKYALEQFKSRLPKWPQYCAHIIAIPHFREEHPDFVAEIEAAISAAGSGVLSSNVSLMTGPSMTPVAGLPEQPEAPASHPVVSPLLPPVTPVPATPPTGPPSRAAFHNTLRAKLNALGEDLRVALGAAASGMQIPTILPSVAAAAVAAKEAEETAAASSSLMLGGETNGTIVAAGVEALIAAAGGMPTFKATESPVASLQDRINFIFNNITESNTDVKAAETLAVLKAEHIPWFATVVVSRIAAMHNQQPILRQYLDRINSRPLDTEILQSTLDAIRRLIISDKIRSEARERSTLKNLGSWLGRITLGKNRPLLYLHMNPKAMLYEAYETGRLIAMLPFVSKVLEAASESSVFRPPNPWTMALLAVLVELHGVIDLKINLKFEVEVLLKTLSLELKDVRPAQSLHARRRPPLVNNPDFNAKAATNPDAVPGVAPRDEITTSGGSHGTSTAPGGSPAIPGLLNLVTLKAFSSVFYPNVPAPAPVPSVQPDGTVDPASDLPVGVDEGADKDEVGSAKAHLRNVVAVAVDRAVRELIQPAVERSVTIAVITARELITKDFASEPDADKMATAAHAFVADLAGSLSLVTCQDVLRASIGNHLRNLLAAHPSVITSLPVSLHALGDSAVNSMLQNVVNENLDLASLLVEKAAMDKAVKSVDEALAPAYAARRRAMETGTPFVDSKAYSAGARWPAALPDALRPRPTGLSPAQLRVYEAFSQSRAGTQAPLPLQAETAAPAQLNPASVAPLPPSASLGVASAPQAAVAAFNAAASPDSSAANAAALQPQLTPGLALQEYNVVLDRLTNAIKATAAAIMAAHPAATGALITPATLGTLPADNDIVVTLKELRTIGLRVPPGNHREDVCIVQAQKLFRGLFELAQPPASVVDALAMQTYLTALVFLKDVCRQLRKDIVTYLAFIPEERRHSDNVILGLIRSQLVSLPDFDMFLSKSIDAGRNAGALRFAMVVMYKAVVADRLVNAAELPATVDILLGISNRSAGTAMAATNPAALPVPPALPVLIEAIRAVVAVQQGGAGVTPAAVADKLRAAGAALGIAAAPSTATAPLTLGGLPPATPPSTGSLATTASVGDAPYSDAIRSQVLYLLEIWVRICADAATGAASEKQFHAYLANLGQQGVLQNDASTERFFRVMMDLCVQSCAATAKAHPTPVPASAVTDVTGSAVPTPRNRLTYTGVDALSKLVYVLVKVAEGMPAKVALFNKLIAIFARTLIRDADANGAGSSPESGAPAIPPPEVALRFDQRPYLRLFTNLLRDMYQQAPQPAPGADDNAIDAARAAAAETAAFNAQILASFANVLHAVKPERVPGFAFAWLEMLCQRHFLPALLSVPGQRGWPLVHRLIVDLFRFLYPALRRAEMNEAVKLMYKGTLRLLLVLHHDFPEFLADYYSTLLDVLPPSCIQLRNLLLTANPKAVRLPDPFQSSGHVETLPECTVTPRMLGNPAEALNPGLRDELDTFLRGRAAAVPASLMSSLKACLFAGADEQAFSLSRYSLATTNAVTLFIAQVSLGKLQDEAIGANASHLRGTVPAPALVAAATSSPAVEVFRFLLTETDAEGRYAIFNAVANQLRYPNAFTLFFSRLLLALFVNPTSNALLADIIREQLTRVMLERVVVHRPQPWGLLVTFIELIKNPTYKFWSHPFTKMNPDIERLFESVARSCVAPTTPTATGAVSTE